MISWNPSVTFEIWQRKTKKEFFWLVQPKSHKCKNTDISIFDEKIEFLYKKNKKLFQSFHSEL